MRASDTAELAFEDMRVPAENLLGQEGGGFYEVMRIFQRERLVAGLHAMAGCQRALEDTIAYVQRRHAFDGPLSEKQVVRHKLADLATLIEAGRWLTYAACLKFRDREEAVREISMVKLFTAEMAQQVAYDCVQLHGGYGYMREYPIERFFRDIRLMTIGGGTSEIMKEIIAKQMADMLESARDHRDACRAPRCSMPWSGGATRACGSGWASGGWGSTSCPMASRWSIRGSRSCFGTGRVDHAGAAVLPLPEPRAGDRRGAALNPPPTGRRDGVKQFLQSLLTG